MARKLTDLVIENIALVDRGANQLADLVIAKRATPVKIGGTVTVGTGTIIKFVLKEGGNV